MTVKFYITINFLHKSFTNFQHFKASFPYCKFVNIICFTKVLFHFDSVPHNAYTPRSGLTILPSLPT